MHIQSSSRVHATRTPPAPHTFICKLHVHVNLQPLYHSTSHNRPRGRPVVHHASQRRTTQHTARHFHSSGIACELTFVKPVTHVPALHTHKSMHNHACVHTHLHQHARQAPCTHALSFFVVVPLQAPPNHYEVLGVPKNADQATIKKAFWEVSAKERE